MNSLKSEEVVDLVRGYVMNHNSRSDLPLGCLSDSQVGATWAFLKPVLHDE